MWPNGSQPGAEPGDTAGVLALFIPGTMFFYSKLKTNTTAKKVKVPFNPSVSPDGVVRPVEIISPPIDIGKSANVLGINSLRGLLAASFRLKCYNRAIKIVTLRRDITDSITCHGEFP